MRSRQRPHEKCGHVFTSCYLEQVALEGSHDFAGIWLDNASEKRDRSRDGLLAKEAKDTQLSQSSIVDFTLEASCLGFRRLILAQIKWIVQTLEGDGVGNILKRRLSIKGKTTR
jgi:hypothetical protein